METIIHLLDLHLFVPSDLLVILVLIFLEGLLSCDNAVALAMLVRGLPKEQQGKALRYGIIGAYVFLIIALCLATWIIQQWYLKVLGGAYLLWMAGGHFFKKSEAEGGAPTHRVLRIPGLSVFWCTVVTVELTDIAFSVDSVAAAVAFSPKFFVLLCAGLVYILVMRFAAQGFIALLRRFPLLEGAAFLAVGFIGLKLVSEIPGDVLGRSAVMPATATYSTATEYAAQAEAANPSLLHLRQIIDLRANSSPAPDATRFITPREYSLALSHWNLHGRALIRIEEMASALIVMALFAIGFLRRRKPTAEDAPA